MHWLWMLLAGVSVLRMCPLLDDCVTTVEVPCDQGYVCPVGSFEQRVCPAGFNCPTPALQFPCRNASSCPPGSTQDATFPAPGAAVFGSAFTAEVAVADQSLSTIQVVRDNVARGCGLCAVEIVWYNAQGNVTYCDGDASECLGLSFHARRLLQASAYALFLVFSEAEYHPTFNETCSPPCINFTVRANARIVYDPAMRRRDVAHLIEEYFAPAQQQTAASINVGMIAGVVGGGVVLMVAGGCVVRRGMRKTRFGTGQSGCMFEGVTIDSKKGW